MSRLAQDLAAARRRRLARLTRGLVVACALTGIVVLGWIVTVRTLDSASRDRSRAAVVEAVEDSDRTLQRATVETLADGFKDDVTLLQRLRFIANSPDRPDVQRLNALMLDNELTTARDPRSRWYIADVSWSDAELSGASLTAVTFQTGTISNVRFTRTHFAGVLWNQSPLNGAPGLMLSNVRFEGSRFEGGEFAGTGGVGVQFVNSHFTGTRLVLENFAATAFKSQSRDPNSPVITDEVTVFERAVVEHCVAKPEPGVLEIVPDGSEVTFDGVVFDSVQFRGWFRPEWFRNSHFIDCILPAELLKALERSGNTVTTSTARSSSC